jgi:hypothetical protein
MHFLIAKEKEKEKESTHAHMCMCVSVCVCVDRWVDIIHTTTSAKQGHPVKLCLKSAFANLRTQACVCVYVYYCVCACVLLCVCVCVCVCMVCGVCSIAHHVGDLPNNCGDFQHEPSE